MIAQHSTESNEHYTPVPIVEAARSLLCGITLDPASCPEANQTVKAPQYFTEQEDGLIQPWKGRVFLNPPGGLLRWYPEQQRWLVPEKRNPHLDKSSAAIWWDKLVREWVAERTSAAVFVGFTLEILRSSQGEGIALPVQTFHRCYPKDRMKFSGGSPTHGNLIVYLPPMTEVGKEPDKFKELFGPFGYCE